MSNEKRNAKSEDLGLAIDEVLMRRLRNGPMWIALDVFNYFDTASKPLGPREFFQFWGALTEDEKAYFMIASVKPLTAAKGLLVTIPKQKGKSSASS